MPYAYLPQCQLYYESKGDGPPVVYVHGGFAGLDTVLRENKWDWEYDFTTACRFIAYDRRGCARSSSPDNGYDLVTQARDLAGLLDALELPSAHIIGSSAGGPIAVHFAALYTKRTRALILTGTAIDLFPPGEVGSDIVRQQLVILEREGAEAAFAQRPNGMQVTFNELWDEPEAIARGQLDAYRARVQRWHALAQTVPHAQRVHYYATELRSMQAYMTTTTYTYAQAVRTLTLILHDSNDQMVPVRDAQLLAQGIPGAQLEIWQGGSHSLIGRNADARRRAIEWAQQIESKRESSLEE